MSDQVSLSRLNKNLIEIWDWFELTKTALDEYRKSIINETLVVDEFIGMSPSEVNKYFQGAISELVNLTCIDLLSAVEAKFRVDFEQRAKKRRKDPLSKFFRNAYRKYSIRVPLEDIILDGWKNADGILKVYQLGS